MLTGIMDHMQRRPLRVCVVTLATVLPLVWVLAAVLP